GSIPLDFAYRIHTDIENKTFSAIINGKMEPLDYELKNGDIVEIITSLHSYGPSQDWLKITQSTQAKSKIRQFFKKQRRVENIEKGKEEIEAGIKELGYPLKEVLTEENIKRVCEKFNFVNEEDLYAAVGYQGITSSLIVTRLTDKIRKEREKEENTLANSEEVKTIVNKKSDTGVIVEGLDSVLVRLSRCCNPVPNDDIVGYITKGRGVSVHRSDCPNIQSDEAEERFLNVCWRNAENSAKDYHLD